MHQNHTKHHRRRQFADAFSQITSSCIGRIGTVALILSSRIRLSSGCRPTQIFTAGLALTNIRENPSRTNDILIPQALLHAVVNAYVETLFLMKTWHLHLTKTEVEYTIILILLQQFVGWSRLYIFWTGLSWRHVLSGHGLSRKCLLKATITVTVALGVWKQVRRVAHF